MDRVTTVPVSGDEREALEVIARRATSFATLADRLGLSGETDELRALCDALDGLTDKGLIERDTSPGWSTYRWRVTSLGATL